MEWMGGGKERDFRAREAELGMRCVETERRGGLSQRM